MNFNLKEIMNERISSKLDLKASDIVLIWIWSILFGATATLSYRVASIISSINVLSLIAIISAIFILLSWQRLYLSLVEFLNSNNGLDSVESKRLNIPNIQENLKESMKFIIYAVISLLALSVIKLIITFIPSI